MARRVISLPCGIWSLSGHSGLWQADRPGIHGLARHIVRPTRPRQHALLNRDQAASGCATSLKAACAVARRKWNLGQSYELLRVDGPCAPWWGRSMAPVVLRKPRSPKRGFFFDRHRGKLGQVNLRRRPSTPARKPPGRQSSIVYSPRSLRPTLDALKRQRHAQR